MLSNKIFGSNKKEPENDETVQEKNVPNVKPPSLGVSESTKYFLSQEETLKKISNNSTANVPKEDNILIDIEDSSNQKESEQKPQILNTDLQSVSSLSSIFNNLQQSLIPLTISIANTKCYTPKLSQKQYNSRLEKLNDINNLVIKDSKTKFLFI